MVRFIEHNAKSEAYQHMSINKGQKEFGQAGVLVSHLESRLRNSPELFYNTTL